MEMMLSFNGAFLRSEVSGANMYDNIDALLPKIEKQILKHKTKLRSKLKAGALELPALYEQPDTDENVAVIAKTKEELNSMRQSAEEELAGQRSQCDRFKAERDEKSKKLSVIYRREDGTYGVLIPN